MPICSLIKHFEVSPDSGYQKIVVTYIGGGTPPYSNIIQMAYSDADVRISQRETESAVIFFGDPKETVWARSEFGTAIGNFLESLKHCITIDDRLDESHAMSLHSAKDEHGNWYTPEMGILMRRAKYGSGYGPIRDRDAFEAICDRIGRFIAGHPRYERAHLISTAPSSDSNKTQTMAGEMAKRLSSKLEKILVVPIRHTSVPSQKDNDDPSEESRRTAQMNTVRFDFNLNGQSVIIVDDLYDSGATIEEVARAAREAGASGVLGITATKNAKFTRGMSLEDWPWK